MNKKYLKRILSMLIIIMLFLSTVPISTLAESQQAEPDAREQATEPPASVPSATQGSETIPEQGRLSASGVSESHEADENESAESLGIPADTITPVEPILLQVVSEPLTKVIYHYYDAELSEDVSDYYDYAIVSTHEFYAKAIADETVLSIAANKHPGKAPTSTDLLRFRVLWNDSEDITTLAEYDADTGIVSLPYEYMGHRITVEWYCPTSDIMELPVKINVSLYRNGKFIDTEHELLLASNSDTISIPLGKSAGLTVTQNNVDLNASQFSIEDGILNVTASALGGDLIVFSYPLARSTRIAGGQVYHTRSDEQVVYGWNNTSYYTAQGNTAYCLNPHLAGMDTGTYSIGRYLVRGQDDDLIKCAYYLYGGPGYDSIKASLFDNPDALETYGYCHAGISFIYMGDSDAMAGLNGTMRTELKKDLETVKAQPMPPDGFNVFIYNEGSSTTQPFMGWEFSLGDLEIIKVSSIPDFTDGNSCYSLAGAIFDVYDSNNVALGRITTDANGRGRLEGITAGVNLYCVEVQAPTGYALNTSRITFNVSPGQTTTLQIVNNPQRDPIGVMAQKKDADTLTNGQGGVGLSGAEFTAKFYKGYYATAAELAGVTPARTWVIRTDANGVAFLHPDHLVSGDPFYYSGNANPTLPLGTLTIQESKAPSGYHINSELYIRQITSRGDTEDVNSYNAPIIDDKVYRGGVTVSKWDIELNRASVAQGDATLEGAIIDIYNRSGKDVVVGNKTYADGALVHTMTTGASGLAATANDLLPYGNYEAIERSAPSGYLNSGVIRQSFSITSAGVTVNLTTSSTAIKNQIIRGGVEIEKWDAELNRRAIPQGDAVLQGAVFDIYNRGKSVVVVNGSEYAPGQVVHTLTTDSNGWAGTANNLLPYSTYEIVEKSSPSGYLNTGVIRQTFTVRSNGVIVNLKTSDKAIKNQVVKGGVEIEKWDIELNRQADPQGDAVLQGAVFDIYNRGKSAVVINGKEYAPGQVVHTLTTDSNGLAGTANNLLPYSSYEIIERSSPSGYLNTGVLRQTFTIRSNGVIVNLKASATVIKNDVIRGGVEIEKWDLERDKTKLKQGDAALENAILDIYNRGKHSVVVNGVEYEPGQVVHTLKTNASGWVGTTNDLLPYSTYEIIERSSPSGYLNTGVIRRVFEIRRQGVIVSMNTSDTAIKNNVVRGGVLVEKWDHEIGEHRAQGGATLEGAVIEIVNRSNDSVLVQGKLYGIGEVVYTMATGKTGSCATPGDLLPYGTYECREASPPLEGYLATGILSRSFVIREHGKIVTMNTADTAIRNNPIRGDLKGVKLSDGDQQRMAGVPFRITSLTTGEAHTVITDKNGEINTASEWNPHSQDTNRGESSKDGIWFGEPDTLDDNLGALLYDDYLIEELPCEANKDKELLKFKVSIYRHMTNINLGTMTNDYIQEPEISTTARDEETTIGSAYTSTTTTIVDTVYFSGLKAGQNYTLKGILMDRESGHPIMVNGKQVTAEAELKAPSDSGSITMKFMFDSQAMKGKSVVVFEYLESEGREIAAHADLSSEEQTIMFISPTLRTSAATTDGKKEVDIRSKVTIVDTVAYSGFLIGESYTISGILMDKATAKPLLSEGKEITASATFKALAASGTASVVFNFDAVDMAGKTAVVFESLIYKAQVITEHADINDENQTFTFTAPSIRTSAAGSDGSKVIPLTQRAVIIDTVSYTGLTPDETYILHGILMDKESGEPLLVDGKEITATKRFIAKAESGKEAIRFIFNSAALKGKTVVVYETLTYNGETLAAHADLADENQSVTFSDISISTSAAGSDASKVISLTERAVIIDTVSYTGLKAGETYTLQGILMDAESGEPLLIDGKEVTATTRFTPAADSGKEVVRFVFNSASLNGKTVVIFETLLYNGDELANHADIEDEAQSVTFSEPCIRTTATGSDGSKIIPLSERAVIVDSVSYVGLTAGETYTLEGVIMDKATNEPLLINGKEVTAIKKFTAASETGKENVRFIFNSSDLKGKTVVVFETLLYNGDELIRHTDIEDEAQSVLISAPSIRTAATGKDGSKVIPLTERAVITDTVTYTGLTTGETYVLQGIIMEKESGEPLLVNGKEITAITRFQAISESGNTEVVFTLNSVDLAGQEAVVFETLMYSGTEIAVHADIDSEEQLISFAVPKISTSASAKGGGKTIPLDKEAVVIDNVAYEGLTAGATYVIKGILMDKETEKPLLVKNKEVTAEASFVPKNSAGSVKLSFNFDSTALAGKTLVVFESLEYKDTEIAVHADISDEEQTVVVSKTPGGGAKTGRDGLPTWLLVIGLLSIAGSIALIRYLRKSKKQKD